MASLSYRGEFQLFSCFYAHLRSYHHPERNDAHHHLGTTRLSPHYSTITQGRVFETLCSLPHPSAIDSLSFPRKMSAAIPIINPATCLPIVGLDLESFIHPPLTIMKF